MTKPSILNFLGVYNRYKNVILPSQLLGIEDEYTAYCFNEACAVITYRIENGEEVYFTEVDNTHYTKPSDIYKKYEKE